MPREARTAGKESIHDGVYTDNVSYPARHVVPHDDFVVLDIQKHHLYRRTHRYSPCLGILCLYRAYLYVIPCFLNKHTSSLCFFVALHSLVGVSLCLYRPFFLVFLACPCLPLSVFLSSPVHFSLHAAIFQNCRAFTLLPPSCGVGIGLCVSLLLLLLLLLLYLTVLYFYCYTRRRRI